MMMMMMIVEMLWLYGILPSFWCTFAALDDTPWRHSDTKLETLETLSC